MKQIDTVFAPWDNTRSPGAVIAVSRHGQVLFARGYGMSNLEHDVPLTPDSIFDVASIAKQFTTACVQLLAAEGKLAWSDDIRRYVPELPDYGHTITLAHLAHHTSGLRDGGDLLFLAGWRDADVITEADVLRIVTRQRALNFAPGEEFSYSNTGYTLLAIIVNRVSGQSFREFAAARIFQPLGMNATHFHHDHTEIVRGRTSAYQARPRGGYRISLPVYEAYGPTGLFTTVGDLLKWEQNFIEPRVGGRAFVEALVTQGTLNRGVATGYGLGLQLRQNRGIREVGHGGAFAGYRSHVSQFPEHGLAIAVFCNLGSMRAGNLVNKVAEMLLGNALAPLPPAVALAEDELKRIAGAYFNEHSDELHQFTVREGRLIQSGSADAWVPIGEGRFRAGESSSQIAFPELVSRRGGSASAGPVTELHVLSPTLGTSILKRLAPHVPSREELAALTGEFSSDELLGARYRFSVNQDGRLECQPPRGRPFVLAPVTRDMFTGSTGLVRFTRDAAGDVTGITLSTGLSLSYARVRRLPLQIIASQKIPVAATREG